MRKRIRFFFGFLLLLGVGLGIGWLSGGATFVLLKVAEDHLLPYRVDKELVITRVGHEDPAGMELTDRVRVTLSRSRVRQMLREAGGWQWAVPPGLLRSGLVIAGEWAPHSHGKNVGIVIPLEIVVDNTEGDHPRLEGTLPVSKLNAYMDVEFADDFVNEDEEYLLGHFDYTFHPRILEATIRTTNALDLSPEAYARSIVLEAKAEGVVRMKLEENLFRTSTKARISDLVLQITAVPTPTDNGVVIDYDAVFKSLKGNVKNLHNYGDKKLTEKLKKKWTRSLNKEKRKQKLARHPIPDWAPLDVAVDLTFYHDPDPEH